MFGAPSENVSTRPAWARSFVVGLPLLMFIALMLAVIAAPAGAEPSAQAATATPSPAGIVTATIASRLITGTTTVSATNVATNTTPVLAAGTVVDASPLTPTAVLSTTDGLPAADLTGVPKAVSTGDVPGPNPSEISGTPRPTRAAGSANPGSGTTTQDSGSVLPWIVGALVLAGLLGVAFFALRPRLAAEPTTPAPRPRPAPPAAAPTTTNLGAATIRCPNCDTPNPADRRFCDECGQDLRPAAAAVGGATTALSAVDEATLPYLETLSRVDEQLEFVLARDRVTLGRAADNDIVIDENFVGWQTVSPHHASLTREGDAFMLEDLQSENGSFVNGARTGQNLLEDGMSVALGKVEFIYRVPRG